MFERFLEKAVEGTLIGLAWLLVGFAGVFIVGGSYAMTGGNFFATIVLLWVTFCLVSAVMAATTRSGDDDLTKRHRSPSS